MCYLTSAIAGKVAVTMATGDGWCPITRASELIGRKWYPVIIDRLLDGPKRFGEIERMIPGISAKVLSDSLEELERERIVTRRVRPTRPILITYGLTQKGAGLRAVLAAMREWGERWLTAE
ncbi:MAG: helix-turn-helix transcriptional regulator [Nitrososphaerota archaeon]|nr:helix-turn-helix transcriptional regulator [Nitrososphaerota archaeon]MDG6938833.1 helix-turn-helix transcriptional regulator [Nitrososphaerota archaeon]